MLNVTGAGCYYESNRENKRNKPNRSFTKHKGQRMCWFVIFLVDLSLAHRAIISFLKLKVSVVFNLQRTDLAPRMFFFSHLVVVHSFWHSYYVHIFKFCSLLILCMRIYNIISFSFFLFFVSIFSSFSMIVRCCISLLLVSIAYVFIQFCFLARA